MSSQVQGVQNYSKMVDKDKAYLIKLLSAIGASVITGILTSILYDPNSTGGSSIGWIGLIIYIITLVVSSFFVKAKFRLDKEMTNGQIIRISIFMSFMTYVFLWIVLFNFLAKKKLGI